MEQSAKETKLFWLLNKDFETLIVEKLALQSIEAIRLNKEFKKVDKN